MVQRLFHTGHWPTIQEIRHKIPVCTCFMLVLDAVRLDSTKKTGLDPVYDWGGGGREKRKRRLDQRFA